MKPAIARGWRGLPGTFWALFVGVLLMALATFVFPFLALFLKSRGYSVEESGLLVALFGVGSIPAGPLAGQLADRIGRRPALIGSLLSAAALTALLPFLGNPVVLAAGTLALGVAVHAYFPVANAIVADVVPPERYDDAYALMYWERNAGIGVSFALGGYLATFGYDRLFLIDASTTLLFALVAFARIPETLPASVPLHQAARARGFATALRDRHFMALLVLNVVFLVGLFQFMLALPVVMVRRALTPADYGHAMMVNSILIMLLSPWVSRVSARVNPGRMLALGAVFCGTGYLSYSVCSSPWHYAAATGLWSLGEIVSLPTIMSLVSKMSPEDLRGRYQGLISVSFGAGLALAPAIGGTMVERFGPEVLWIAVACSSGLVALAHLAAGRARKSAGVGVSVPEAAARG